VGSRSGTCSMLPQCGGMRCTKFEFETREIAVMGVRSGSFGHVRGHFWRLITAWETSRSLRNSGKENTAEHSEQMRHMVSFRHASS